MEKNSDICLGCAYFGTGTNKLDSMKILDEFYENKGRIVDTANCYASWMDGAHGGESERVIGEWMKVNDVKDLKVMTKIGFEYEDVKRGIDSDIIIRECEKSLERLNTQKIDTYFLHLDTGYEMYEILSTLNDLYEKGLIGEFAASNHRLDRIKKAEIIAAENNVISFSAVENHYTYLKPNDKGLLGHFSWEVFDEKYLNYCNTEKIKMYAHTVMLWGAYFDKFKYVWKAYDCEENREILRKLEDMAHKYNESKAGLAIHWMIKKGVHPIIGASSSKQICEIMKTERLELNVEDMKYLEDIRRGE